jgi:hypothetical protein
MARSGDWRAWRSTDLFGNSHRDQLTLRLVFHQPLRQTERLLRSIAAPLDIDIAIPDHTTLIRRGGGLTVLPSIGRDVPLHLLIDSTGLKIYGEGEWLEKKRGIRSLDGGANCISASMPIHMKSYDVSELVRLLDQGATQIGSVIADGAYDSESVYDAALVHEAVEIDYRLVRVGEQLSC